MPILGPLRRRTGKQVWQRLVAEFELVTEQKEKPVMRAEDEFKLLRTLFCSTKMTFDHERYRVELALILQLADITGNRPAVLPCFTVRKCPRYPAAGQRPALDSDRNSV